ncbi:MAG: hydroxymethylglutaryl-CoA lyase [Acidobacteria bacterium]|nr:hydroxymethylglutaryl-CoA lyase [Acidobacteriota bacterium]
MPESVTLIECPRDAFQGLPHFIPTETKIDYLLSLIDTGFRDIDFGSFVSSKAVPQMRDTPQVLEAIRPRLEQTRLIAIVPNLRGLEAAINAKDIRCAGYALSVSETFQQRNFHQTLEQAWAIMGELLKRSQGAGMEFVVYLSMAFGNPYADAWSLERVVSLVDRLVETGVRKISLADTVGLAQPQTVHELFSACRRQSSDIELGAHLHARPDRWEDVVMAAYSAGCRRFDGALLGMGGCPLAGDHLVGNIPTEGMVQHFSQMGLKLDGAEESIQTALRKGQRIVSGYS